MSDARPPVFSDRYQLIRHIARGGMAQVYLAQDLLLDRAVALKVLFPELSTDQNFVLRFRREAQAAANLSHPNIVSVYDWGQGDRTYFIVLEYVDGPTLATLIRRGPVNPRRAAAVGADVAGALEFAHRHNVIHRDIKPGNVLLDRSGTVKVTDFGIARAIGASEGLTQTGSVMGTATYFSPEQAQGNAVDARTDVYSLGIVLYEMVAGRPPYTGDNPVSIAYKHVREQAVPLRQINPNIPAAYEAIVQRAMAKSVDHRYQTAGELQADLRRFATGRPVAALAGHAEREVTSIAAPIPMEVAAARTQVNPVAEPTMVGAGGDGGGQPVYDDYEDERRPSRSALWIALAVAALVVAGVAAFLIAHQVRNNNLAATTTTTAATLTMPNVVGMTEATARTQLMQVGFTNITSRTSQDNTVPQGQVISTNPAAGATANPDERIALDVSRGPHDVAVPDVVGKDQQDATNALTQAGFTVHVATQKSNAVDQGLIIKTNPAAGAEAPHGSQVTITVSTGAETVAIPSLEGQTPTEAGQQLASLGLSPLQLTEASATIPAGEVTRTDPGAGSVVAAGSTVNVYVSTGPAQVSVPAIIGDTQAQAQAALSNAGLTAQFTPVDVTDPSQNGLVQSQNPSGGNQVDQGSTVQVIIGTFVAPTTTTTTTLPPTTTTLPTTTTSTTTRSTPPTTTPLQTVPTT